MENMQDKDKLIGILEKKLQQKDAEINELYGLLGRLNAYISNLVEDAEEGIRAAMALHRRFTSRKFPDINDITFSSKYVVSTSDQSSYYDIYELPEKSGVGMVVCDTRGYGLSATVMSIVISLLETALQKSPGVLLETTVNDILKFLKVDKGKTFQADGKKISIIYATIERKGLKLKYCSSGMPGLVIVRDEERILLESDSPTGDDDLGMAEKQFDLKPGDRIFIPNNGLIGAVNSGGDLFGVNGIITALNKAQHIPVSDCIASIGYEVDSFTEGKRSRLGGDLAIIGMELERRMLYVV
ncbi:MAG: SpoIIE family protein phosphatase [Oligoflexia bacterium]|nr:SpoIIE family protein phosphatase [Oligoflexia bacterium]